MAANEKAKAKGLKVSAGLQRHHDIRYQEVIKRIRDGAIGELTYLRCYFNSQGARPPFIRKPDMTEMEYQLRNLYYFTWLSGDHIVEQHIHNINACNWIKGDYPISAQGQGGRQVRTGKEYGEIYDHHFVEFAYKDEVRMLSQCRHIQNTWYNDAEHAHGTKGVANISSGGRKIVIEGPEKWRFRGTAPNPYQVEHDVLFDAICNDKPHNEVDHAAKSTLTAIMGRMATYSGKVVTWDQALNSEVDLSPNRYAWDGIPVALPDKNGYYPAAMPGVTKAF